MNMNQYESIIKSIVRTQGGYREKDVMSKPHTYEQGGTWNDEHKVIDVIEIAEQEDGYRQGFSIDLITRSICG